MKWNLMELEFRLGRKSFLTGASIILLFQLMMAAFADTFIKDPTLIKLKVEALPPALVEGFGIHLDLMTSYEGWMAGQAQTYYVLLMALFGVMWASSAIARERELSTKEFLFSLPYSRGEVLFSRAAVHIIRLTAIMLMNAVLLVAAGHLFSTVHSVMTLVLLSLSGYLSALAAAGLAYVFSVVVTADRGPLYAGIGLVLLLFVLNMLGALGEPFRSLSKISLFRLFPAEDIVNSHALTWIGVLVTLGIYAGGLRAAFLLLRRRDV